MFVFDGYFLDAYYAPDAAVKSRPRPAGASRSVSRLRA